jgi:hypothetical protein
MVENVTPDLADQYVLGALPHSGLEEVKHPDGGAEPFRYPLARDGRNPVLVVERDLASILDRDDLCKRRYEKGDRVERCGLSRRGAADEEQTFVVLDRHPEVDELVDVEGLCLHQFDGREGRLAELSDRERCTPGGDLAAEGELQPRTVGEGCIHKRAPYRDVLA